MICRRPLINDFLFITEVTTELAGKVRGSPQNRLHVETVGHPIWFSSRYYGKIFTATKRPSLCTFLG
jgi:hypothetical protein